MPNGLKQHRVRREPVSHREHSSITDFEGRDSFAGGRGGGFWRCGRRSRETGEEDLFRSRLDQIIELNYALAKLARAIDWSLLEREFGAVHTDAPGHPPLPTRLMAGLAILKHSYDLSDEGLCER